MPARLSGALGALAIWLVAPGSALAQDDSPAVSRADLDSPIVPVHDEPHHRQLFQYGPMRILELQVPPNDMSWFHTHEWPVLYMTLGSSATRSQVLGSDWSGGGRRGGARAGAPPTARGGAPAGGRGGAPAAARGGQASGPRTTAPRAFSTTSYIDNPVTHRIENIGDGLFRAMVVINETEGDDSTSVEDAGFEGEPELTNAWFRSYRIRLEPGESTASHEHRAPVVILQGTDGTGLAHGPMNWEFNEPGQWAFYDSGVAHTIENLGDEPMELLEIEVRRK